MLNNVARSLVSLVRGSGIRKDYIVDDSHEIGRGRFGIVLHAQRIADGESVAIKKIAKRGRSSKAMDNIRNEIEVMKKVKHPHCIPLYNVYESANHIYIVMELVCVRGECERESSRVGGQVRARASSTKSIDV